MSLDAERNEYQQLVRTLNYHSYRYHVLDTPVISDYEYDKMLKRLLELEAAHPEWISPDSPSQRAGSGVLDKFVKVRHPGAVAGLGKGDPVLRTRERFVRAPRVDLRVSQSGF